MTVVEFYGLAFLTIGVLGGAALAVVAPVIVWRALADGCFMGLQPSTVYKTEQARVIPAEPQRQHDEKH